MTTENTIPKKIKDDVAKALKNGYHKKALKLVKDIPDDDPWKIDVVAKAEKMAEEARAKAKPKAEAKLSGPKVITHTELLEDYQSLYDKLAVYELQQRKIKKPFRHVVVARRRLSVFMLNFKRSCG